MEMRIYKENKYLANNILEYIKSLYKNTNFIKFLASQNNSILRYASSKSSCSTPRYRFVTSKLL